MHLRIITCSLWARLHASMASALSERVAIPVEIITDFPFDAIYSINGKSVISREATLYADTSIVSGKSTALLSKAPRL